MPLRMRALRAPSKIASRVGEDLLALLSVAYGNQRGVIEQQRNRMDRCHGESHGAIPQWGGMFFHNGGILLILYQLWLNIEKC